MLDEVSKIKEFLPKDWEGCIIIYGKSCTGKDTLADEICKEFGYERVGDYTTRPRRYSEKCTKLRKFISTEMMSRLICSDFFSVWTNRNGIYYGIPKIDYRGKVLILDPPSIEKIEMDCDSIVVKISCGFEERVRRYARRENCSLEEARKYLVERDKRESECEYQVEVES